MTMESGPNQILNVDIDITMNSSDHQSEHSIDPIDNLQQTLHLNDYTIQAHDKRSKSAFTGRNPPKSKINAF